MRGPGSKIKCVGLVYINMPTERIIGGNGGIINSMGRGSISSPMVRYMREIGKIINFMGLGFISMSKAGNGRESLEMGDFSLKCRNSWLKKDKLLLRKLS